MAELSIVSGNDYFDKVFEENLKERRIILSGEIDESCIEQVVLPILEFNRQDKDIEVVSKRKPILLYISSNGGDVSTGMAIVDTIINSKTPIFGVVVDIAYSMAGLILLACDKKYCFKHSTILIHDGFINSGTQSGKKFKNLTTFLDETDKKIRDFIIERSNITKEQYEDEYGDEIYMYSDKAKELGLVDKIVGVDCSLDEIL